MKLHVLKRANRGLIAVSAAMLLSLAACVTAPGDNPKTTNSSGTSTSAAPTSAAPTTTTPKPLRTTSVVMSGDLLWHNTLWKGAAEDNAKTGKGKEFDFDPMFAHVKPIISQADLAICHEEVPFAKEGGPYTGYPSFQAPPQIAAWIATMGWDACTAASNHSIDAGYSGLVRTYNLLKSAGVTPIGIFPTEADRNKPVILNTKQGIKVGVVSGTYDLNGYILPDDKKWAVSMWDADNLLAQAKAARKAGADIVMVSMHGGDEYDTAPNMEQTALAEKLTASPDVDLVFGEHVHVVQPITKINGKWVVFGMGNMVAQHLTSVPRGYEGITVRFQFTEKKGGGFAVTKAEYIPTYITHYTPGDPPRLYAVNKALAEKKGDAARLKVAKDRTKKAVDFLGKNDGLIES